MLVKMLLVLPVFLSKARNYMLIFKDEAISLVNTNMNFKTSILQESIKARKLG